MAAMDNGTKASLHLGNIQHHPRAAFSIHPDLIRNASIHSQINPFVDPSQPSSSYNKPPSSDPFHSSLSPSSPKSSNPNDTSTFSPPSGPPPGMSPKPPRDPLAPPPTYLTTVSMKDPTTYNSDSHLLSACRVKGISPYFATQLMRLREYSSIRLILDDSGSMKAMMNISGAGTTTRWALLQSMVKEIFDLMAIARSGLGPEENAPIEVFFLNMLPQGMKADTVQVLQPFFAKQPSNTTPTREVMEGIFTAEHMMWEEGVLTLLITDGAPNCGHVAFKQFLLDKQRRFPASYITIGLCTDDPATINEYEESLDNGVPHLDVMSAYEDESRQIRSIQGRKFTFTYQDWCVKFLLGSRVVEWDSLDEKKLTREELERIRKFEVGYLGGGGLGRSGSVVGGAGGGGRGSGAGGGGGKKKKDCVIM